VSELIVIVDKNAHGSWNYTVVRYCSKIVSNKNNRSLNLLVLLVLEWLTLAEQRA
jgi:hypothetical protein